MWLVAGELAVRRNFVLDPELKKVRPSSSRLLRCDFAQPLTFAMSKALALLLVMSAFSPLIAQGPPDAPKPPPPREKPEGDRKSYFGPTHRGPGGPGGMNGFDKLSEAERKRVREAMDIAWKKPEMQAAKDKFTKASEEFRAALRDTLQGIDPEVVKILEKVKPPMPWEYRGGPPPLRPEDPEFANQAVARMGMEMATFGGPEKRDAMQRLHERLINLPSVKEAVAKLQAAPVGERMETFKAVREIYRKEFELQVADYRRKHAPDGPK